MKFVLVIFFLCVLLIKKIILKCLMFGFKWWPLWPPWRLTTSSYVLIASRPQGQARYTKCSPLSAKLIPRKSISKRNYITSNIEFFALQKGTSKLKIWNFKEWNFIFEVSFLKASNLKSYLFICILVLIINYTS